MDSARRKWPKSLPPVPRWPVDGGTFTPPSGDDPKAHPTPCPQRVFLPLPIEYVIGLDLPTSSSIAALGEALRRHLLLFLWYAYPNHLHVPVDMIPDKGDLYDQLEFSDKGPAVVRPADQIFEYASVIEQWLKEQQ